MNLKISVFLAVFTLAGVAQAGSIHRCVDTKGKVAYSDAPCEAGATSVKKIEAKDYPKSPASSTSSPQTQDWARKNADFESRRAIRQRAEQDEEEQVAHEKAMEQRAREAEERRVAEIREKGRQAAARRHEEQVRNEMRYGR